MQLYAHTNYASKRVTQGFFFRNPNTRLGVFSIDSGRTLLIGDALAASGRGSANCPTVAITDHVPDPAALQEVLDDPDCFSFQELFPGGFTPQMGGTAADASLVGGVRGSTAGGFDWDVSASIGMHGSDLFIRDTVNASLGPASPTSFDVGANRQREISVQADLSYRMTDRVNLAAGAEWRDEQFRMTQGDPESWTVGPYAAQRFMAGANGFFGFGPQHAGAWSRYNVAAYGDLEVGMSGRGDHRGADVPGASHTEILRRDANRVSLGRRKTPANNHAKRGQTGRPTSSATAAIFLHLLFASVYWFTNKHSSPPSLRTPGEAAEAANVVMVGA